MKNKSARGAATRQRILEAAAALVDRQGFNGTSVDDVLAASSTGKSQFYHYFSSKTQLALELVEHHLPTMPLARLGGPEQVGDLERLEAALEALVTAHRGGAYPYGCAVGNLASELVSGNDELGAALRGLYERLTSQLAEAVRGIRARGQLRPDVSPEGVAAAIAAGLQGGFLLAKVLGSSEPLAAAVQQLKAQLRALAPAATGASKAAAVARPGAVAAVRRPRSIPLTYCP